MRCVMSLVRVLKSFSVVLMRAHLNQCRCARRCCRTHCSAHEEEVWTVPLLWLICSCTAAITNARTPMCYALERERCDDMDEGDENEAIDVAQYLAKICTKIEGHRKARPLSISTLVILWSAFVPYLQDATMRRTWPVPYLPYSSDHQNAQ